jgi:hypothetical protein
LVFLFFQDVSDEFGGEWMNRKSLFDVGLFQAFVVLGVLVFFTCQSFAGVSSIYKWKDEKGKVHFTDDPLKIPHRYRSDPNLDKRRGLPPIKSSSRSSENKASADGTAENQKDKEEKTDADKKKEGELAAMRDALSFLKSDIERYKKYKDYVPQKRHAILLRDDIVSVLPSKEALAKKLEPLDSSLAKQISGYLKTSLQKDYEAKKREYPRRTIFITERLRINGEQTVKSSLIKKLTAKLASVPEKASSQPKPPELPKPQEPAEDSKEDALKKARNYSSYYK